MLVARNKNKTSKPLMSSINMSGVKKRFTKATIHLLLFSPYERSVTSLRGINDVIREMKYYAFYASVLTENKLLLS